MGSYELNCRFIIKLLFSSRIYIVSQYYIPRIFLSEQDAAPSIIKPIMK